MQYTYYDTQPMMYNVTTFTSGMTQGHHTAHSLLDPESEEVKSFSFSDKLEKPSTSQVINKVQLSNYLQEGQYR